MLVVDVLNPPPTPGVDFIEVADAVAAARGGEIILVRPGDYASIIIDKPLVIIADAAQDPVVMKGGVSVHGLLAGESVVLRGLVMAGGLGRAGLDVEGCAGPVWAESCKLSGGFTGEHPDGARVADSLATTLVRCTLLGGEGIPSDRTTEAPQGAPGLRVSASLVAAWLLQSTGGSGWSGDATGGAGGAGVRVEPGAQLFLTGGTFTGGFGAGGSEFLDEPCDCLVCHPSGAGGAGLATTGPCTVELRDVALQGGVALPNPGTQQGCVGSDGLALSDPGRYVYQVAVRTRALRLSSPVREGEELGLALSGVAGDTVLVLASLRADLAALPAGTLVLDMPLVLALGALPPSGELSLGFRVPELGPGVEGLLLVAQPLLLPIGGGKVLGAPSATVLLDSQFF